MVEVTWTIKAHKDLYAIYKFVKIDSGFYAERLVDSIFNTISQLEKFPYSGRIVPEINDETIREVFYGNYRIFYKIQSPQSVIILRIHHSARRIK